MPDRSKNAPSPSGAADDVIRDELRTVASAFCFAVSSSVAEYCGGEPGGGGLTNAPVSWTVPPFVALRSCMYSGPTREAFTCSSNHTVIEPASRSRTGGMDALTAGRTVSRTKLRDPAWDARALPDRSNTADDDTLMRTGPFVAFAIIIDDF